MFICNSDLVADRLCKWGGMDLKKDVFDFTKWRPESFSIQYETLFKRRWIKVWGLPLICWTLATFQDIGKSCGGLRSVDRKGV